MQRNYFLTAAFVIVSVFAMAKPGNDPATLIFKNNDVESVNVFVPGLSSEIFIMRKIYDEQGNLLFVGGFTGWALFGDTLMQSHGLTDLYLAKFTPAGKRLFVTAAGGSNSEIAYDLSLDRTGNIYVVGSFTEQATLYGHRLVTDGESDALMLKYDRTGQNLWLWDIVGGKGEDKASSIVIDAADSIYVGGTFTDTAAAPSGVLLVGKGSRDLFLLKFSPADAFVRAVQSGDVGDDYLARIATGPYQDRPGHWIPECVALIWTEAGNPTQWYIWYDQKGNQLSLPEQITQ